MSMQFMEACCPYCDMEVTLELEPGIGPLDGACPLCGEDAAESFYEQYLDMAMGRADMLVDQIKDGDV